MNDSDDDYFSDDLVLDDKTLAVLDEEESKFKRTTNTQTQQSIGPPTKRQKTTTLWQPQSVRRPLHRADTLDDLDDLPDVSIRQDGTYGLQDKQRRPSAPPSRSGIAPRPNGVTQPGSGPRHTVVAPVSRGSAPLMRSASVSGSVRANQVPSRQPSVARSTRVAQSPVPSQEVSRTQSGPLQRAHKALSATASDGHVRQLLQQIEQLRKENEAIQASMESALEAKFAKEGEVTILRKRMEKTAQDHSAQLAKLKAAKDEADAKQVVLQKQYEADKERLKTELTFRRHELETSVRNHSVGFSLKKDVSQPAEPAPFQRQRSTQWPSAGPSRLAPEGRRPRFGVISDSEKSKKTTGLEMRDLPSGFQTAPSRSQFIASRKGKETNPFPNPIPVATSASPLPQVPGGASSQPLPEVFGSQMEDEGPIEDIVPLADGVIDGVQMADEGTPVVSISSQENTSILSLQSQNHVLSSIMQTHTLQGSTLPTLQLLLCASPVDTGQGQSYGSMLMRIFDTLGGITAHPDGDFDHLAQIICCALCEITELLAKNHLISPLTAVLNLLTNLTYMLSIHALLLSQRASDHDRTPRLLRVLHHIIQDQLQELDVTTGNEQPELCSLGKETLSLYEALVWWVPDDLEDCLNACSSMPALLMALLHPHRPLWFLTESMRVLLWLSTRRSLFRSLLSHPAVERTGSNGEAVDLVHHPQISRICSLLTDTDRRGPEADEFKSRIIMFLGMLSNAHPDAYMLLVESQELIPLIVVYLNQLAAPIWDENGAIVGDPEASTRAIHIINHATLLLHHLVIGEDATLDLRERLLHVPSKTHHGLIHGFILTFGRLSYANPPYWLDDENRQRLAGVADLARALLELVIQGPELDLIWETYQDEGDDSIEAMDVDDDEVEAQKIANSD